MNKWQKEITRFAKRNMQKYNKGTFVEHRSEARHWSTFYTDFDRFKASNNRLIESKSNK